MVSSFFDIDLFILNDIIVDIFVRRKSYMKKIKNRIISGLLAGTILMTASSCAVKNSNDKNDISDIPSTIDDYDNDAYNANEVIDDIVNDDIVNDDKVVEVLPIEDTNINKDDNDYEVVEINNFAYVLYDTPLYDSNMVEIDYMDKYQKVSVINNNGNMSEVCYYRGVDDFVYGYIYNDSYEMLPSLFVEVDISDQIVNMYVDSNLIISSDTVTGKTSTPTRIGYFGITYKTMDTYLRGSGYCSHVDYWMPFDGGIGLHDAAWRDTFGGDIYINSGSHGCVNLPNETARTIYNNVEAGSKVLVHK